MSQPFPSRRLGCGLVSRRFALGGLAGVAVLALPGCAAYERYSLVEVVRRLLQLSADRAFARLLAPGGFWDDQLARLALPEQFGRKGDVLQRLLSGPLLRDRLQRAFNDMAGRAAYNAAPAVAEAIRGVGLRNAQALIAGRPDEATTYLRGEMAGRLIDIMVPQLGDALRLSNDPLVAEALAVVTGVDVGGLANTLAAQADDAIWRAIGREEAAIRADPRATGDPLLMRAFGR